MPNTGEKLIELLKTAKTKEQFDFLFADVDDAIDMPSGDEYLANYLIANGVTVQEWIPVTEHLPQEDQPLGVLCELVQVLLNDGTVTVGICNRGFRCWFHIPINGTSFVGHNYDNTPVVAWQPLANPPGGTP